MYGLLIEEESVVSGFNFYMLSLEYFGIRIMLRNKIFYEKL